MTKHRLPIMLLRLTDGITIIYYPNTALDDVSKVRKIRDIKSEETKLLQTDKRYAVGSIQPFL